MRESYIHGYVVPFRKVEHYAMATYRQLQSIARDMGVGRLMKFMDTWIRAMLAPKAL